MNERLYLRNFDQIKIEIGVNKYGSIKVNYKVRVGTHEMEGETLSVRCRLKSAIGDGIDISCDDVYIEKWCKSRQLTEAESIEFLSGCLKDEDRKAWSIMTLQSRLERLGKMRRTYDDLLADLQSEEESSYGCLLDFMDDLLDNFEELLENAQETVREVFNTDEIGQDILQDFEINLTNELEEMMPIDTFDETIMEYIDASNEDIDLQIGFNRFWDGFIDGYLQGLSDGILRVESRIEDENVRDFFIELGVDVQVIRSISNLNLT